MTSTTTEALVELAREGLYLAVLLSAPAVVAALFVGFLVSAAQAATQIHEHTLSFAPKILAVLAALALFAPWIGQSLQAFTVELLELIPRLGG